LTSFLTIIINVVNFLNSYFLNNYINFIRFIAVPSNQNRDNFIDKAFTVIAESIVKIMPIAEKEKKAYIYYRDGLAAQNNGDYSEALEYYKESLLLEENKIDRGETLKNMAIIYMSNGEEDLSIETYEKALVENPKQPSCLKNIGLIYEKRGRYAEQNVIWIREIFGLTKLQKSGLKQ